MKNFLNSLIVAASLLLIALTLFPADDPMKVPAEIGVRIRNVQLDQSRQQNLLTQLQIQYQQTQQTIERDTHELDLLKTEALSTAKLDKEKYDIDFEKLIFFPKPAAPPKDKKP